LLLGELTEQDAAQRAQPEDELGQLVGSSTLRPGNWKRPTPPTADRGAHRAKDSVRAQKRSATQRSKKSGTASGPLRGTIPASI